MIFVMHIGLWDDGRGLDRCIRIGRHVHERCEPAFVMGWGPEDYA